MVEHIEGLAEVKVEIKIIFRNAGASEQKVALNHCEDISSNFDRFRWGNHIANEEISSLTSLLWASIPKFRANWKKFRQKLANILGWKKFLQSSWHFTKKKSREFQRKITKILPNAEHTGLHILNFFKSQEEELIILVAFFLWITEI